MPLNKNLNHESTFSQKVEFNSDICDNCYRRLSYTMFPHPTEMPDCVTSQKEYSDSTEFEYFDDNEESGHPSVKKSYCKCGSVHGNSKIRPLKKDKLMKVAGRVLERLDEMDVEVEESEYYSTISEEKSDPDNQFNEEVILESALEDSIIDTNE